MHLLRKPFDTTRQGHLTMFAAAASDIPVLAYPTLSQAATMLGVSPSTLSRRSLPFEAAGARDKRLRPSVVLREAAFHRRRRLGDVGTDLIAYAETHAPDAVLEVRAEVEAALARTMVPERLTIQEFLGDARSALPPALYERVAAVFEVEDLPRVEGSIGPLARSAEAPIVASASSRSQDWAVMAKKAAG